MLKDYDGIIGVSNNGIEFWVSPKVHNDVHVYCTY